MKKLKIIYSLCVLFLFSCTNLYQAGYSSKEVKYLQKANPKSKTKKAIYFSGTVSNGYASLYREFNKSYEFSTHYSESTNNSVFAVGAFAYLGDFHVQNVNTDENTIKDYHGFGFRFDSGVNLPLGGINWRIINMQAAISYEGGQFFDYRKETSGERNSINFAENRITFSPFIYTDLAVVGNDVFQFNFYTGYGWTINSSKLSIFKAGLGLEIKNFVISYEESATLFPSSSYSSFSFAYKF
jgi:hypothetical protein